ncbi:hypothetical protein JZU69_00635, partial [bacterium]|nr:hypothetical protein [bacterium]
KQAEALFKTGQLLPKPLRGKGGTGPIRMAQVKQLQKPKTSSGLDPIAESRQKALTQLAELLFEYSDDSPSAQERKGLSAIMKGTGGLSLQQSEQTSASRRRNGKRARSRLQAPIAILHAGIFTLQRRTA